MRSDELAARLLSMFVEELEEQLRVINEDLLTLERAPADSERLRSLFRSMHSLKGAARAANVAPIEELCHALEGELAQARDGQRPLTPPQLLHGFAASDALADAARRLRAGETIPVGEYDALLLAIRSGSPLPRSSGRSGAAESPPPAASPPPATAPAAAAEPVVEQRAVVGVPDREQGEDATGE
jgi:two-component system, chemotaxis family, sensor kinase CheA